MVNIDNNLGTVYWITGLSGAGKTTVGTGVYEYIRSKQPNVIRLDGDILREIFKNTDYSYEGRKKLGFRYSDLCRMIALQGIDVVISTIVMFDEVRDYNRETIDNYREIYLRVPIEELEKRDQKGLYTQAKTDDKTQVYGMTLQVEFPKHPDVIIDNYGDISPNDAIEIICDRFLKL